MSFIDRLFPFTNWHVIEDNILTTSWIAGLIFFFLFSFIYWLRTYYVIGRNINIDNLPKSKVLEKLWDAYQNTFSENGSLRKTKEYSEDFFNDQNVLNLSVNYKFVSNVSNTLVGLGILGTFVGLTYGITDSDFETTDAIKKSITNLLAGMGTAFVTSIWGMGLSLLFTISFKITQSTLNKNIQELCLDLDRNYKIQPYELEIIQQEDKHKIVVKQQEFIHKIVIEQQEYVHKLVVKQQEYQSKLVAEQQENQRKVINELLNEYLVADTDEGKQLPKNVFRQLLKESENQTLALQSFSDDLAESIKVTMETLVDNNNQQISRLIEEKLVPVLEDLKAIKQDSGTQVIQDIVHNLSDSLKKMMSEFKDTVSTDTKLEMENLMKRLTTVSESLIRVPEIMSNITTQVSETINLLRKTVVSNLEQSKHEATELSIQNKDVFSTVTAEYKSTVEDIQAYMKSLLEIQKENILQVSNISDEMKISIKDNRQVNLQIDTMIQKSRLVAQLIENVSSNFEKSSRTLTETSSSLKESTTRFGNSIENYVGKNEHLLDHQEVVLQNTKDVAEIYGSRFEVIEKGLIGIFSQIQIGLKEYEKTTASNLNQYLAEFSSVLKTAHEGLENNISNLSQITEELTEQMDKRK